MLRKLFLPAIFALLAYGFWISPDFNQIAAGVAIFLMGMLALEEGFKAFTGGVLEKLLRRTTDKLWKSLCFGVVSTSVMQSSSLVSVITISFLSAGLISLTAGVGIIFGANLGTTTGAWLLAGFGLKINISAYAMPMLVFGVILIFQKSRGAKGSGFILAGLGALFLGIHHMKEGFDAFKGSLDLTHFAVEGYLGVLLFSLLGVLATVVMQSSHATLVLTITGLAAGQITYENALALAIGANIGTTITAIIGSLGANVDGRRLAGAHLIFNAVTAAVAIGFIFQLTELVDWISVGLGIAPDNYTLKLAVFHSVFNGLGILLMLPFLHRMVDWLTRLIKPRGRALSEARYLNSSNATLPDTAIEAVRKETFRLYDNASAIIAEVIGLNLREILTADSIASAVTRNRKSPGLDIDERYENSVKAHYALIVEFISSAQSTMSPEQSKELSALLAAGRDIVEAIKDTKHLQKNLARYVASANPHIRHEYDQIRANLARSLRSLDTIRKDGGESGSILSLDAIKVAMKRQDQQLEDKLSLLIREQLISAPMAISLMNDSGYAYHIIKNLVKMGEVLFSTSASALKEAERSVSLDEAELEALLQETTNSNSGARNENP